MSISDHYAMKRQNLNPLFYLHCMPCSINIHLGVTLILCHSKLNYCIVRRFWGESCNGSHHSVIALQ